MKNLKPIVVLSILMIAAVAFLISRFRPQEKIALPGDITTIAAGYPFAVRVKDKTAKQAQLFTAFIDLDREGSEFRVPEIDYGFALRSGGTLGVVADNAMRAAYVSVDASDSPSQPQVPSWALAPIDLSLVKGDVSDVLALAKTNGLDEFCAITTADDGTVELSLANSENGPVWMVSGDGWSNGVPVAELAITIDARTGAIRRHSLDRAIKK